MKSSLREDVYQKYKKKVDAYLAEKREPKDLLDDLIEERERVIHDKRPESYANATVRIQARTLRSVSIMAMDRIIEELKSKIGEEQCLKRP